MNKKTLLPLAFVPLAATNLQAQSNMQIEHADKRPNIILFRRYGMAGYFTPILDTENTL